MHLPCLAHPPAGMSPSDEALPSYCLPFEAPQVCRLLLPLVLLLLPVAASSLARYCSALAAHCSCALARIKPSCHMHAGRHHPPLHLPTRKCKQEEATIKILTRKPILPSDEEQAANARSRSAKLRVVEKL